MDVKHCSWRKGVIEVCDSLWDETNTVMIIEKVREYLNYERKERYRIADYKWLDNIPSNLSIIKKNGSLEQIYGVFVIYRRDRRTDYIEVNTLSTFVVAWRAWMTITIFVML